jgi:hypothetical protein
MRFQAKSLLISTVLFLCSFSHAEDHSFSSFGEFFEKVPFRDRVFSVGRCKWIEFDLTLRFGPEWYLVARKSEFGKIYSRLTFPADSAVEDSVAWTNGFGFTTQMKNKASVVKREDSTVYQAVHYSLSTGPGSILTKHEFEMILNKDQTIREWKLQRSLAHFFNFGILQRDKEDSVTCRAGEN